MYTIIDHIYIHTTWFKILYDSCQPKWDFKLFQKLMLENQTPPNHFDVEAPWDNLSEYNENWDPGFGPTWDPQ